MSTTNTAEKRDYRQEVTDSIIQMLEKGTAPWQKPWVPGALEMPFNPTSEKQYRGGNALHLMTVGVMKGYGDPRWMTYRQAQENGWQVQKGEKGTAIEYWEFREGRDSTVSDDGPQDKDDKNGQRRMIHRVYTVFNAAQIEGIPSHSAKEHSEFEVIQAGESILENSRADIHHDQRDRAYYSKGTDQIHLPPKSSFKSAGDYYGTALHELGHWTGHSARLNRETLNASKYFGDANYAREELRAELTSVFLAAERGIPHDPANHAAYVGSWIKALEQDKNEIFRAAKDAHRAADFVLSLELGKDQAKENEPLPQERLETSELVAQYEPATGTVKLEEKAAVHDERIPATTDMASSDVLAEPKRIVENAVEDQIQTDPSGLKQSLTEAQALSESVLGDQVRTFCAQTDSGIYRGEVIGETDLHMVQRLSNRSAVAHMKHLLERVPAVGEQVTVTYAHDKANVRDLAPRDREKELCR